MAKVAVICGGVGAARLLRGLVHSDHDVSAIVNVADDVNLHGLHVSPDLDTITYTLAGASSAERGWGLEGETWQAMEMLGRYGGHNWFSLGDRDLGTHLYRTARLAEGASLTEVTAEIASAWDLALPILPVTNDRVQTMVTLAEPPPGTAERIGFQEYFVGLRHSVPVAGVDFVGAENAKLTREVADALDNADVIIVAPSNPVVSIDPVLAIGDLRSRLANRRHAVVAISPIVGGQALKGPADRLLAELGRESSAVGVARWYADVVGTLVIDNVDAGLADSVAEAGPDPIVTDTIMVDAEASRSLAEVAIRAVTTAR